MSRGRYNGVFSGICVGGPCDGQQCSYREPCFQVEKRKPLMAITALPSRTDSLATETVEIVTYVHDFISFLDHSDPLFIWRMSNDTIREAVQRLLANYPRGVIRTAGGEPDLGA